MGHQRPRKKTSTLLRSPARSRWVKGVPSDRRVANAGKGRPTAIGPVYAGSRTAYKPARSAREKHDRKKREDAPNVPPLPQGNDDENDADERQRGHIPRCHQSLERHLHHKSGHSENGKAETQQQEATAAHRVRRGSIEAGHFFVTFG